VPPGAQKSSLNKGEMTGSCRRRPVDAFSLMSSFFPFFSFSLDFISAFVRPPSFFKIEVEKGVSTLDFDHGQPLFLSHVAFCL